MTLNKQTLKKIAWMAALISVVIFFMLLSFMTVTHAAGLVDETVSEDNLYSLYPLDHYQLDFYVDEGWDWLPWNWNDGIGKQVMYGLYTITNFIWIINLYLSNATGYLVQQAYSLDFISDTATAIGQNIQTLAGITSQGFGEDGFYVGFLLLFVLIIGIYVAYTGLLKQETTKAIRAILNFLLVFIVSGAFIAFAPTYITKINEFSADISEASLDLGTRILMPSSDSRGKDSVDMIRNNLFSIQVEQPWMLLQFDDSDKEAIGEERVEALVSIDPNANNGEDREAAVQAEIEDYDNKNLTITKTTTRLGMVSFLFLFNIGISIFVFLLSGIMIFSQILFIIFAMFLPISFLLSMIPTFEGMAKQAILKLFNVIMLRAGITLIITVAFSISSMIYSLTATYPFFLIAFLQIVTFAGIYMKLGDIMGMFRLQSSDSQQVGRKVMHRPRRMAYRGGRQLQRTLGRTLAGATAGATIGSMVGKSRQTKNTFSPLRPLQRLSSGNKNQKERRSRESPSISQKVGQTTGKVLDTKKRMRANIQHRKQQVKDLPTTTKYALTQGKEQLKRPGKDFKKGVYQATDKRQRENTERTRKHRQTIAEKRQALEQKQRQATVSKQSLSQQRSKRSEKEKSSRHNQSRSQPKHKQAPVQANLKRNQRHFYRNSVQTKKQGKNTPSSRPSEQSLKQRKNRQAALNSSHIRPKQAVKRPLHHERRNRR
ncbi:CD3337/EF1877 family mobilome membrane protein [Oceanobacillus jeddahense]